MRQRTRIRNQVHAVLTRNLLGVRATDAFGKRGRAELAAAALPEHERFELDSALRLHDALEAELAVLEGRLCAEALEHTEVRRLMTIPGVGAVTALSLVALIGDVSRFATPRQLVGYLGLDPRVASQESEAIAPVTSRGKARPTRTACWSRPPWERSRCRALCGPFTRASALGAAPRSRASPPPASSRC